MCWWRLQSLRGDFIMAVAKKAAPAAKKAAPAKKACAAKCCAAKKTAKK